MTDRELMQDALDALNNFDKGNHGMRWQVPLIKALRAALAQPEPEAKKYTEAICPVCGYYCLGKGGVNCIDKPKLCGIDTAPPQREWVGLTDDELHALHFELKVQTMGGINTLGMYRILEAKLKEKNG